MRSDTRARNRSLYALLGRGGRGVVLGGFQRLKTP